MTLHSEGARGLCLAIEMSNPNAGLPSRCGAAVGRIGGPRGETQLLSVAELEPAGRERDDVVPCIHRAIAAAQVCAHELDCVAVSVGPGGFTSLRMATAAAGGLAVAAEAIRGRAMACAAVPTALVAYTAAVEREPGLASGPVGVALASKAGSIWGTVFLPGARVREALAGARVVTEADAGAWLMGLRGGVLLGDEHVPEHFRSGDGRARFGSMALGPEACLRAAAAVMPVGAERLVPEYGREPEAVTLWRMRHGGGERGAGG